MTRDRAGLRGSRGSRGSRGGGRWPAHLLYHLPHFPLLALKHVVQVVDLLPQPGHLALQVRSPEGKDQRAETRGPPGPTASLGLGVPSAGIPSARVPVGPKEWAGTP